VLLHSNYRNVPPVTDQVFPEGTAVRESLRMVEQRHSGRYHVAFCDGGDQKQAHPFRKCGVRLFHHSFPLAASVALNDQAAQVGDFPDAPFYVVAPVSAKCETERGEMGNTKGASLVVGRMRP